MTFPIVAAVALLFVLGLAFLLRARAGREEEVLPEERPTFYDYVAAHPEGLRDGKIVCVHCGAVDQVNMDKAADIKIGTLNKHVCRACGSVLYYSVCACK